MGRRIARIVAILMLALTGALGVYKWAVRERPRNVSHVTFDA
jgi:hypothetical protein